MKTHVVLDVEMCRVQMRSTRFPYRHEIIQIGAVKLSDSYEIVDEFSTYVRPRYGKVDFFIKDLTGITEQMVKQAPDIEEALQRMVQWVGEDEADFYSWSDTDYYQIRNEILCKCQENACWDLFLNQTNWVDYQAKFSERLESPRALKLAEALGFRGDEIMFSSNEALDLAEIDPEGHLHDGLADAYNTARLIAKLETQKDYRMLIERNRTREKNEEPLTTSLGAFLQGLVLESA